MIALLATIFLLGSTATAPSSQQVSTRPTSARAASQPAAATQAAAQAATQAAAASPPGALSAPTTQEFAQALAAAHAAANPATQPSSPWAAGAHNALDPAGVQAYRLDKLWWCFFWVTTIVYIIVLVVILAGVAARRRPRPELTGWTNEPPIIRPDPLKERRYGVIVGASVGLTTLILCVLTVLDFGTGRAMGKLADESGPDQVTLQLTGHQWWWEARYEDADPHHYFTTANEIHIPVGKVVHVRLKSGDVIHSFWIPSLTGKKDMIPGHESEAYFKADRAGTYEGQCAEFCGLQHANMRLRVIAEPQDQYDLWLARARSPAQEPQTPMQLRGQQVFLSRSCVLCHTISGTTAGGRVGPNLTHLASRTRIAAGTRPNVTGYLAGWIVDPQKIKPGVRMPQNQLPPADLRALLEYLESLK